MAKNKTVESYETEYKKDYQDDWDIHRNYIQTFDAYEAMLIGAVYDSVSGTINSSKITDSYAATLAIERAARVMGKLPDGMTESMAKADQGKAAFMDILRQKWIYPNANAQHPFQTKLRLWQLYSSVYGYMPMFYDWNISTTGYVGPDSWLWNPRHLIPQQGRTSIADMDRVTALVWVGKKFLEDLLDKDDHELETGGWDRDGLTMLLQVVNEKSSADIDRDTFTERERTPGGAKKGICLATTYQSGDSGRWCTFAPDHGFMQVRERANPHQNSRIPFVIKYSQPLFDSFYGLGDFQRAKPLQFARDGLTNFYFSGIKMNLVPPIIVNANGVIKTTIDYREGAVMEETIPNSIRRLETSNAGLATYQAAQSNLTGSLLALYGSQNAAAPGADTLNPSQGKTPAAINMYSDKEATRDGQEREYLEESIEELTDGMFSLVANIGTEDIPVNLFSDDIQAIVDAGLADVQDLFKNFRPNQTQTGGVLTIDPAKLKDVEYRFNVNPGSTAKANKDAMRQTILDTVGVIGKLQNVLDDPRVEVHWNEIMSSLQGVSDEIPGIQKWITFDPNAQPQPEPAPAQAPSPTAVQAPSGNVHETADLVKLYQATADEGVRMQILKAMGFEPSPVVTPTGHTFKDPHVAAAAAALTAPQEAGTQTPPPEPTVHGGGVYNDPTVGKAAEAITKL